MTLRFSRDVSTVNIEEVGKFRESRTNKDCNKYRNDSLVM